MEFEGNKVNEIEYIAIATAEELRAATDSFLEKKLGSREELNRIWIKWFMKRAEKMLSDTVRKGLYELTLDLPYQPSGKEDFEHLKSLGKMVSKIVPGCCISFVEEDYEGSLIYKIEICWKT